MERLLQAGYNGGFTTLEDAVGLYVREFLSQNGAYR
jgi:hypothetical protein